MSSKVVKGFEKVDGPLTRFTDSRSKSPRPRCSSPLPQLLRVSSRPTSRSVTPTEARAFSCALRESESQV